MTSPQTEARELFEEGAPRWAPPLSLSVSEWAARVRVLPESSAARGGPWRNEAAPYLAGIMDVCRVSRDDGNRAIRKVAIVKCHQSGGSSALENVIGYHVQHEPCPILVVHPTHEAAREWSKERLSDMIRSSPALAALVRDRGPARGERSPESTLTHMLFPGGQLFCGGANTPNTFARRAVRLAIADDFDRFPAVVGEEGDPADLLVNRTTSFYDGLSLFLSTPTVKGGRIDTLFRRSDQRRFHLTCPKCNREDWTTWSDEAHFWVKYQNDDPATARLACPCGALHDEAVRRAMVSAGVWKATRAPDEVGLAGFHLPAMVSTLGSVTLEDLVSKWISAQARGREALRAFVNTSLAEAWVEPDTSIKLEPEGGFMSAREEYETIPMAASLVTGAIDVQDDRFELLFCAWGPREETWLLDHRILSRDEGPAEQRFDPYDRKSYDRLYIALFGGPQFGHRGLLFEHESGKQIPVSTVCIDSGFLTAHAYRFSRFDRTRIFATKGVADLADGHLIRFSTETENPRRPGIPLVLINTGACKQRLADRIADKRVHFPLAGFADEEFFAQLTAEEATPVFNPAGVRVGQKWVKKRPRNEILDLLVLNIGARQIRGAWDLESYRRKVGLP